MAEIIQLYPLTIAGFPNGDRDHVQKCIDKVVERVKKECSKRGYEIVGKNFFYEVQTTTENKLDVTVRAGIRPMRPKKIKPTFLQLAEMADQSGRGDCA